MIYRSRISVGELEIVTPATVTELRYLAAHLRPEERGEADAAGLSWESCMDAMNRMRRSGGVYHRGEFLAIVGVTDLPQFCPEADGGKRGARLVTVDRTTHALEKGHRFAWLKGYTAMVRWFIDNDRGAAERGPVIALSPTDDPRAVDVYRHVGARIARTVVLNGREYWVLAIGEK